MFKHLIPAFMIIGLSLNAVNAQEKESEDPIYKCEVSYDECMTKCELNQDGSEKCYVQCEEQFLSCQEQASKE